MSVLHPASFKEFRSLMCLWQALKLWKKQLEVRSLIWFGGVTFEVRGQHFQAMSQSVPWIAMQNFRHEKAWTANQNQQDRLPRKDGTGAALMTADVLLPIPVPLPLPPKPSLIPFRSWHSIASRCCYGVDVRLPGHREHIRRDSLKPVTYTSGRVTLGHLNARSSESWRGTTNFIFLFDR